MHKLTINTVLCIQLFYIRNTKNVCTVQFVHTEHHSVTEKSGSGKIMLSHKQNSARELTLQFHHVQYSMSTNTKQSMMVFKFQNSSKDLGYLLVALLSDLISHSLHNMCLSSNLDKNNSPHINC